MQEALDRDFQEVAGDLHTCEHATALCSALRVGSLWQPCEPCTLERLESLLHPNSRGAPEAPVDSDGVLTVRISTNSVQLLAVRLAEGPWGLVSNYLPTAAGRLRCLLCKSYHCPHTGALDAGEGGVEHGMDRDKFQAALNNHVDPATGKRRVTSLSKLRVPEEGLSGDMEDQRAAGIIEARMSGSEQLPRKLSPAHGACSCGAVAWEDCEPHECSVYGRTFVQSATWHNLRCGSALAQERVLGQVEESARLRMRDSSSRVLARRACEEVRGYDGSEDCVLLQTAKFAVVWELLLHYSARLASNMKTTFYGFWCDRHFLEPAWWAHAGCTSSRPAASVAHARGAARSIIRAGVLSAQGGPAAHLAAGWRAGRAAGHNEDLPRSGHVPGRVVQPDNAAGPGLLQVLQLLLWEERDR